ncbi:hypothetical protein PRIO_1952 [Paenibacillus riograndensis SBR5]|uniref:Uncharacterized protein n=1 Tax=Paenibacillus riograndensis SBR5 TaxID=1073571 RepID=A0A0E4H956_9BACL|nr:hypothetical protein PRIO_1952 [Paenibacillus riograndensis SBR5]
MKSTFSHQRVRESGQRSPYFAKNLVFSAVTDSGVVISIDGAWNKGERDK